MLMTESNSPAHGHAPKLSKRKFSLGWSIVGVILGMLTGAVGTVLHLNSYWTGSFGLPWGVVVALVIAWLAQYWIGLRSLSIVATGLTGIAQYLTLAALVGFNKGDHFSVPLNAQTWEFVPHLVIATLAWNVGIVVLTLVMMVVMARLLRHVTSQLATPQAHPTPASGVREKQ